MTDPTYAANIIDGQVAQVIVGTAQWASDNLGGLWVDSPVKVGAGWGYLDGQIVPPAPDPSWTWDGTDWQAPDGWEWPTMPGVDGP